MVIVVFSTLNVFGQKKTYSSNVAKEVTEKLGITLVESRAGFVYYDEASNKLMPYLGLKFKNNVSIQKRRRTGEIHYEIKRNGAVIKDSFAWGESADPGVNNIYFLIYNVQLKDVPDDNFSGYTIKCWFEPKEGEKVNIGEFAISKINYKMTYRGNFVYYDGKMFQRKYVNFNNL